MPTHIRKFSNGMAAAKASQKEDCASASANVPGFGENPKPGKVAAGFDGFVDNLMSVVDQRTNQEVFTTVPTLDAFGKRITAAAGESCNVEIVTKIQKIGGNGPIMCNAMLGYGAELTYIGCLGADKPLPVFDPLVSRCKEVITLCPPGITDALEFKDGKLMLGKLETLKDVTYDSILAKVGKEKLVSLFMESKAIVSVNWTMVMNMTAMWRGFVRDIFPELQDKEKRPVFFVDIADPKKRTREDLKAMLDTLTEVNEFCDVVLSLNCSETRQCLETFGETWDGAPEDFEVARVSAAKLQALTGIHMVQVHLKGAAAGATAEESVGVPGYYTANPLIVTGGGDHFNSGFLSALLSGCSLADSLRIGGATSGNYVRGVSSRGTVQVGTSPLPEDTAQFLKNLPIIDEAPDQSL